MPNYTERIASFLDTLTAAGVPFDSTSLNGDPPEGLEIQFKPEATQEQIDWANQAKATFDWRPRRLLTRSQIVAGITNLTQAQQNALLRHLLYFVIRQNKQEVLAAFAEQSLPIAVEEVDPNP